MREGREREELFGLWVFWLERMIIRFNVEEGGEGIIIKKKWLFGIGIEFNVFKFFYVIWIGNVYVRIGIKMVFVIFMIVGDDIFVIIWFLNRWMRFFLIFFVVVFVCYIFLFVLEIFVFCNFCFIVGLVVIGIGLINCNYDGVIFFFNVVIVLYIWLLMIFM